jgi:hypothetical protein
MLRDLLRAKLVRLKTFRHVVKLTSSYREISYAPYIYILHVYVKWFMNSPSHRFTNLRLENVDWIHA